MVNDKSLILYSSVVVSNPFPLKNNLLVNNKIINIPKYLKVDWVILDAVILFELFIAL